MTKGSAWEEICRRCGECCFEKKIDKRGSIHTTAIPCRFLDLHERTCRIYQRRFEFEEDCIKLTPDNIQNLDWLPVDCAYRLQIQTDQSMRTTRSPSPKRSTA